MEQVIQSVGTILVEDLGENLPGAVVLHEKEHVAESGAIPVVRLDASKGYLVLHFNLGDLRADAGRRGWPAM